MCTLMDKQYFKSFRQIKNEFGLENADLFRYLQLRHYYDAEIKKEISMDGNDVIEVLIGAYKQTPSKIVSKLYSVDGRNTMYIKAKWEKEFCIVLSESDWHSTIKTQHTSTSSKRWREFGWKNLIRFFITPKIKNKQLGEQQQCWRQCGNPGAHIYHLRKICQKTPAYPTTKIVIISIGLNNKDQDPQQTSTKQLRTLHEEAKSTFPIADIYFPIRNDSPHLTILQQTNLQTINTTTNHLPSLKPLPQEQFQTGHTLDTTYSHSNI